jgi:TonB family protein
VRRALRIAAAALLCLGGVAAEAQQAPSAPSPAATPAAKITKPKLLEQVPFVYPPEALAQGHSGKVVYAVTVGSDGAVKKVELVTSSRSPILDQDAARVIAGLKFTPALDGDGKPVEYTLKIPLDYQRWMDDGKEGGGILAYRCADFTLDNAWWASAHTDENDSKPELYTMMIGLRFVMQPPAPNADGLKRMMDAAKKDWDRAESRCKAKPDALVIDQLELKDALIKLAKAK